MMTEIKSSPTVKSICGFCTENVSKYCCPRCETLYCSLSCYKSEKHQTCSEEFYKECITEELAMQQGADDSQRKMIEILKRIQNGDLENDLDLEGLLRDSELSDSELVDSDDDGGEDLHDRIKNLDLNNADQLWSVLTDDERNEFNAIVKEGDIGAIIPMWVPWWMYHKEEKLVQDINQKDQDEKEALKKCPSLKEVPKLNSLTSVEPSKSIKYNIANIVSSYVFVTRYFNGELEPVETSVYLLNICANLDVNANFDDINQSTESVAQRCLQSELIQTDELSLDVMKQDTVLLLQGPSLENQEYYCKAALSHIHSLFIEAKSKTKPTNKAQVNATEHKGAFAKRFPDHDGKHLPDLDISKIKKCIKKLEYFLSFLEDHSMLVK